jgi:hypothetical protein
VVSADAPLPRYLTMQAGVDAPRSKAIA